MPRLCPLATQGTPTPATLTKTQAPSALRTARCHYGRSRCPRPTFEGQHRNHLSTPQEKPHLLWAPAPMTPRAKATFMSSEPTGHTGAHLQRGRTAREAQSRALELISRKAGPSFGVPRDRQNLSAFACPCCPRPPGGTPGLGCRDKTPTAKAKATTEALLFVSCLASSFRLHAVLCPVSRSPTLTNLSSGSVWTAAKIMTKLLIE